MLDAPEVRDRLTRYIYVSKDPDDPTGLLEVALKKAVAAEEAEKKLERAIRAGTIRRYHGIDWIGEAMAQGHRDGERRRSSCANWRRSPPASSPSTTSIPRS